jgi:hypothetical protein
MPTIDPGPSVFFFLASLCVGTEDEGTDDGREDGFVDDGNEVGTGVGYELGNDVGTGVGTSVGGADGFYKKIINILLPLKTTDYSKVKHKSLLV